MLDLRFYGLDILPMYVDIVPNRTSSPAILLRESYRGEDGKVKKRTLANLSALSLDQAHKMRKILKGGDIAEAPLKDAFEIIQSLPHGNVAVVLGIMNQLKLPAMLGRRDCEERRNVLALIAGRILFPGSKLALSRQLTGASSTLSSELKLENDLNENDLYRAMRWLWERQERIQNNLAKTRLTEGSVVLYDLSSSYYEGSHCALAKRGYNRDGKKGKTQINYGVITDEQGCPIAVEIYPGNTSDPSSVSDQLKKIRHKFGLKKVTIVGDRGMLTSRQLELAAEDERLKDFGWISALRSDQIRKLTAEGVLQPELFDQRALAEIKSEAFPDERLVVCRNPELASKRGHVREELLKSTEVALLKIQNAIARTKNPYRGAALIGRRVEREAAKYKMLKHYILEIEEDRLHYTRQESSIKEESRLDGFYVIRARNVPEEQMQENEILATYKSLSGVERVFRNMKTSSLKVRPIFHRESDMVRAHIFLCMIAGHVQWHMEQLLKPVFFADEELQTQKENRPTAVEPTKRSAGAKKKAATKKADDEQPIHNFATLFSNLATITKNTCQPCVPGAPTFQKLTQLTSIQKKVFKLLNLPMPKV
jgi:transposase